MSDWHAELLPFEKIVFAFCVHAIFFVQRFMLIAIGRELNVLVMAGKVKKKNGVGSLLKNTLLKNNLTLP
jgi:hypothetical protein